MGLKLTIYILGLKFLIYILGLKFLIYIYGLEISNSNSQVAGWEQFIQYWETWENVLLWEVFHFPTDKKKSEVHFILYEILTTGDVRDHGRAVLRCTIPWQISVY